jgi:hypothetical protein
MATRIGGPKVGGFNPSGPTWGSMRSPLVLNAFTWNASYTEFSRQWPLSVASPPKFFKWDSGSLFRQDTYGPPPYYTISNNSQEVPEPPIIYTGWSIGIQYPNKTVDNHDFLQLVGEALDTDIGTFIITADAHDPNQGGQTLSDQPPGGTEIYDIGKLTGF